MRATKIERKRAKELLRMPPGKLTEVPLSECPFIPNGMTRAFQNNRYVVMIYENSPTTKGSATRVMIQRHDDMPIPYHWREIQSIKNQIFGTEVLAIEYYPRESELVDEHNIYWIWIFPDGVLPEMITVDYLMGMAQ